MFDIERQSRLSLALAVTILFGASYAAIAAGASAISYEVGPAPRRHVPQDISGWEVSLQRIGATAATRDIVVQLYNNVYLPGNAVALTWSGSVASCTPGTTNLAHQQAVIDRINYFRTLVGLPPAILLAGTPRTQAQAAALMTSANGALSHDPPTSWPCYSAAGAAGAANSSLAVGINGVGAIDLYMTDPGSINAAVGDRRWLLYPPRAAFATGDVPFSEPLNPPANGLYVFGPTTTRPATPNGIAWPPAGYVPYQNLPSGSNRWSLSYPGANFLNATVTMSGPSGVIPVTIAPIDDGYGDNTIVFRPTGVSYAKPPVDTEYTILINGITGAGVPPSIQYTVTVIDPISAGSPPVLANVVSRRVHGAAGTFDLPLGSVTSNPSTEPRQGPTYTIVFTFDKAVNAGAAAVTEGTATAGVPTFSGDEMHVPLTNVANQQYVTVSVSNVDSADGGTGGAGSIRIGFLLGDASQNRVVSLSDLAQVNAQVAQFVNDTNYLYDVNASGTLSLADKAITNSQVTKVLPPP